MNKLQVIIIKAMQDYYGDKIIVPDNMTLDEAVDFICSNGDDLSWGCGRGLSGVFLAGKLIASESEYSEEELYSAFGGELESCDFLDIDFNCYDYYKINNTEPTPYTPEEIKAMEEYTRQQELEQEEMDRYYDELLTNYEGDYVDVYCPGDDFETDWINSLE